MWILLAAHTNTLCGLHEYTHMQACVLASAQRPRGIDLHSFSPHSFCYPSFFNTSPLFFICLTLWFCCFSTPPNTRMHINKACQHSQFIYLLIYSSVCVDLGTPEDLLKPKQRLKAYLFLLPLQPCLSLFYFIAFIVFVFGVFPSMCCISCSSNRKKGTITH